MMAKVTASRQVISSGDFVQTQNMKIQQLKDRLNIPKKSVMVESHEQVMEQVQKIFGVSIVTKEKHENKINETKEVHQLSRKASLLSDVLNHGFTPEIENSFGEHQEFMEQFRHADKKLIEETMKNCEKQFKIKLSQIAKRQNQERGR